MHRQYVDSSTILLVVVTFTDRQNGHHVGAFTSRLTGSRSSFIGQAALLIGQAAPARYR